MFSEVANIAAECLRRPRTTSIWSPQLEKYVCENTEEGRVAASVENRARTRAEYPPINRTFKFVFLSSFAGTLLFVALCVILSLAAGREPPPLFEKMILATFDLAQIGFGAIVGLLGGKFLEGESPTLPSAE